MVSDSQNWLDKNYPNKEEVKQIDVKNKQLKGQLIIQDFPSLEKIECGSNKELTNIELINLPQLNYFHANNCQLTDIEIKNCSNISYFNVANNLLTDLVF